MVEKNEEGKIKWIMLASFYLKKKEGITTPFDEHNTILS
jgi:hypothetical protein